MSLRCQQVRQIGHLRRDSRFHRGRDAQSLGNTGTDGGNTGNTGTDGTFTVPVTEGGRGVRGRKKTLQMPAFGKHWDGREVHGASYGRRAGGKGTQEDITDAGIQKRERGGGLVGQPGRARLCEAKIGSSPGGRGQDWRIEPPNS